MQRRISGYMAERVEILAAISHDLQTPITRMRLRTDLMDSEHDRDKFRQDLDAMHALVREGVTYARTLHGATEPARRIDADALFESMVADYEDAGQQVRLEGRTGAPIVTRPNALRRILMNLIDNALSFGSDVRLQVHARADGSWFWPWSTTGPAFRPTSWRTCSSPSTAWKARATAAPAAPGWAWPLRTSSRWRWARSCAAQPREGGLEARLT
jgi:signal transduction histidine kinase